MAAAFILTFAFAAKADGLSDYEHARKALAMGMIAPLAKVFAKVEELFDGEILEVNLEDHNYKGGDDGAAAGGTGLSLAGEDAGPRIQESKGDSREESGGAGTGGSGLGGGKGPGDEKDDDEEPKSQGAALEGKESAGEIFYIIKLLSPQGNVLRIEVDAKTVQVLKVTGRGAGLARKTKKKG